MIYSLYSAMEELPKKQASELLQCFSKSLSDHTHRLL
jgi:hypothetical protein